MLKPGFEKQVSLEECRRAADDRESLTSAVIRAKVRFDYRGKARPSRFFFGGKRSEEAAEELRQQQAALWQNVPVQGIYVENIEQGDLYTVYDEDADDEITFAPLEIVVRADSLSHLVRFAVREEFRRIKILEPLLLNLSIQDMEQVFFQINGEARTQVIQKTRRYHE